MRQRTRPPRPQSTRVRARPAATFALEAVEPRLLFHTSAPIQPLADWTVPQGSLPTVIDLSHSFNAAANRTRVAFEFDAGRVIVELYEDAAPLTVANFLNYARSERYDNTVVHRSVDLNTGEPFVIQGGGYHSPDLNHIATDPPIQNEFRPNTVGRGTIAMAKSPGNPDSATSEWFFNLRNNADVLDLQNGGFTSFGEVVGNGMAVVDAIGALPTITQPAPAFPLEDFPVHVNPPASPADWVDVATIAELVDLTGATSNNPGLVAPVLDGTTLTLNYVAGASGTANVTVNGVDRLGGTVLDVFQVTVLPPAPPPPPEQLEVTLGTGGARSAAFTDADGTAATISVSGGTAVLRFTGTGLSQQPAGRGVAVGGTGLELAHLAVTGGSPAIRLNAAGGANGVTISGLTSTVPVRSFTGRDDVVLRGPIDFAAGLGRLDVMRADNAAITVGGAHSSISIGNAIDSDLTAAGMIRQLRLGSWGRLTGESDVITAPAIGTLQTSGDFAGDLRVTGAAGPRSLNSVRVRGAVRGGAWTVGGAVGSLALGRTESPWAATFAGPVSSVRVASDLAGAITAGSVRSVRAASVTGANITLTQPPAPGATSLGSLNAAGAISDTRIRSSGNIGTITAASVVNSSIFAGVVETAGEPVALPNSPTAFNPGVSIRGVNVRNRAAPSFVASYIAAASLGRMNLGMVNTNNGGVPFGVAALDIASISVTDADGTPIRAARLGDPSDSLRSGDAEARLF